MPLFNYTGTNASGKKVKGKVDAASLQEVVNKLRSESITILDIYEAKKGKATGKVKSSDIEVFARQLSSLISARIPIVKSLGILANQTEKKSFREIIQSIQKNIEAGNSLADSFSKYPEIFSTLFTNMINVGEFSGNLDTMLERLASHIESYNALIKKVQSAMMYPIGVMLVAGIVMAVIFTFVIPGFEKIFSSMGSNLPLPTQFLIDVSNIFRSYSLYIIIGLGLSIFGLKKFLNTPKGIDFSEKAKSKMPVMGELYQKMILARFTKTLAILVKSGISILNALDIAGRTSGSNKLEVIIATVKEDVSRGKKLADALTDSNFFPPMAVNMIGVGEEGGDLGGMLDKIAELYEKDVDAVATGLLSLLEPAIIVFLGVVIGGIVICLFLPIMKMHELVG